ncbi:MAG: hypothetical protein CSA58_12145 [Micrococcales bacterium]|nr:MAG: hypothetical protein CSB46_07310 [Micrococcales bacterium]PIE25919.1 MAG: hypothetical protein CSA58_12145 [Micrococcales bacterium]
MDWLDGHAWEAWVGLALVLGAAEMLGTDLILLMLAAGALTGAGAALLGAPLVPQIVIAAMASAAMLVLVRPSIVKRLHDGPELRTGYEALVGKTGQALTRISSEELGRAKLAGEVWSVRPEEEHLVMDEGSQVEVVAIEGATAVVRPAPGRGMYVNDPKEMR